MKVAEKIHRKLQAELQDAIVQVVDDSAKHAGHAGAREGGESHFNVRVVSASFSGLPRVKRHQLIYQILAEEMRTSIHALALTTLTPEEAASL